MREASSHESRGVPRVLIFSIAYEPFVGGAEIAVKEVAKRLAGDFSFDLITVNLDGKQKYIETIGNIRVHRVGVGTIGKFLFPLRAVLKALFLERTRSFDITWAIMANYAGVAALFFKLLHPSVRFVLSLQEGDPLPVVRKRMGIALPLFKLIFKQAEKIHAISLYLALWAREMGARCPITIVPNGVDVEKFKNQKSKIKIEELRKKLGITSEDNILITSSRLVEKNGVWDIIQALQHLPKNVKLVIAGTGPLEKDLQLITYNLQLTDRVKFLGQILHEKLPDYLHSSDIFVRPSLSEGMGNSFIEAMAAEVPVIGTAVGGIPEFLHDGETGLFCAVRDPKDLALKIRRLLEDDNLRTLLISNARQFVREKYDWSLIALHMKSVLLGNPLSK